MTLQGTAGLLPGSHTGASPVHPDPADVEAQNAILDDRQRPYFEHRLAA